MNVKPSRHRAHTACRCPPRAGQVRMVGNFAACPAALAQPPKPTVRRSRQS
ncbi:transposase (IS4 family) [Burkholderia pseudomallei S13]|nr:transposase (IS4 family) [Burkholderia pseudomallei S13]